MDSNHYQVVRESLVGERAVDEKTFSSLAVLSERLEHLKKVDGAFFGVEFSPAVKQLSRHSRTEAVC